VVSKTFICHTYHCEVMDVEGGNHSKRKRSEFDNVGGDAFYGTVRTVGVNQVKKLSCILSACSAKCQVSTINYRLSMWPALSVSSICCQGYKLDAG
jgi:hypothetical protein